MFQKNLFGVYLKQIFGHFLADKKLLKSQKILQIIWKNILFYWKLLKTVKPKFDARLKQYLPNCVLFNHIASRYTIRYDTIKLKLKYEGWDFSKRSSHFRGLKPWLSREEFVNVSNMFLNGHSRPLFRRFYTVNRKWMFVTKNCWCLDSNLCSLMLEATTLPTTMPPSLTSLHVTTIT